MGKVRKYIKTLRILIIYQNLSEYVLWYQFGTIYLRRIIYHYLQYYIYQMTYEYIKLQYLCLELVCCSEIYQTTAFCANQWAGLSRHQHRSYMYAENRTTGEYVRHGNGIWTVIDITQSWRLLNFKAVENCMNTYLWAVDISWDIAQHVLPSSIAVQKLLSLTPVMQTVRSPLTNTSMV